MEQLQYLLFDALRPLVTSATQFVELGQTAGKLITILETMHKLSYLIIDIKPDNFMVASTLGTGPVTDASLADALRLIDLGLVKALRGMGGHAANDRIDGLAGNALYASLNVHELNTPSRRDDVQSILLMIADMVLTVQAIDQEKAPLYGKGDRASHLPWSQGNSDEAVGAAKRAHVLDEASDFFQEMPDEAAKILSDCIAETASYTYKQKPEYEKFRQALSTLKVPRKPNRSSNRKPAAHSTDTAGSIMSPPTPKSSRKTSRSSASSHDAVSDTEDQQDIQPKRSSKAARTRPLYDGDDDVAMEEATVLVEETANVATAMADVDLTVKGFGLYCDDADVWIVLTQDKPNVVVGKNPSSTADDGLLVLDDCALEPSHVTLSLAAIAVALWVTPHNEAATVYVEDKEVQVSGTIAHVGQKVKFGGYTFKVHSLPIQSSPAEKVTAKHHELTKSPEKPRAQPRTNHHEQITSPEKPTSAQPRHRRVRLEIVAGSFVGNKYEMHPDSRNVIIVGSEPSGDGFLVTLDEKGVEKNHVRFELSHNAVSGTTVTLHDLGAPFGLGVNEDVFLEQDIICITDNSVIKLSNDVHIAVTFIEENN
jgi:hypothetical protein